jgi:hypothetical protein
MRPKHNERIFKGAAGHWKNRGGMDIARKSAVCQDTVCTASHFKEWFGRTPGKGFALQRLATTTDQQFGDNNARKAKVAIPCLACADAAKAIRQIRLAQNLRQ